MDPTPQLFYCIITFSLQSTSPSKYFWDPYLVDKLSSVAYAENFHGGFHSVAYGGHLYLVCAVCDVTIWSHIHVSKPTFSIICIFFYTHSPCFLCHCTKYKLSALQVRISEENKLNATTQQFITAKISGCALKQGSKTHSSLRQSHLQLQNQAAL